MARLAGKRIVDPIDADNPRDAFTFPSDLASKATNARE
jgi:hypothetical protein